ncbi:MAG: PH domain-containing protein [Oligosphaeraceae bacterium]
MRTRCPLCQNVQEISPSLSGMVLRCPQCQRHFFADPVPEDEAEGFRACPFCHERVRAGATRCRWCHGIITGGMGALTSAASTASPSAASTASRAEASPSPGQGEEGEEEEELFRAHPSWKRLLAPMSAALLVVGVTIPFLRHLSLGMYVVLAMLALCLYWFLANFGKIMTTTYVLSTHRLLVRTGFLVRQEVEVGMGDIRAVWLRQNFWEQLLGYGDVMVGTAATSGMEVTLEDVDKPQGLQAIFRERKQL